MNALESVWFLVFDLSWMECLMLEKSHPTNILWAYTHTHTYILTFSFSRLHFFIECVIARLVWHKNFVSYCCEKTTKTNEEPVKAKPRIVINHRLLNKKLIKLFRKMSEHQQLLAMGYSLIGMKLSVNMDGKQNVYIYSIYVYCITYFVLYWLINWKFSRLSVFRDFMLSLDQKWNKMKQVDKVNYLNALSTWMHSQYQ